MPIRPENAALYPDNWDEIADYIKWDRAEGRCECDGRCGDPHCHGLKHGRCNAKHGEPHPVNGKKTVLTCAHLDDRNPANCDEDNLGGYCARCHIIYDREQHAESRKETMAKRQAAEQQKVEQTTAVMKFQMECGL